MTEEENEATATAARKTFYNLVSDIPARERTIKLLGYELEMEETEIINAFFRKENDLPSVILDILLTWRNRSNHKTYLESVVALKKHFESIDLGGIYQRALGLNQIGKKNHPHLDETCPKHWRQEMTEINSFAFFLCKKIDNLSFRGICIMISEQVKGKMHTANQYIYRENQLRDESFPKIELLENYLNFCQDSPQKIIKLFYSGLHYDLNAKKIYNEAEHLFNLSSKLTTAAPNFAPMDNY